VSSRTAHESATDSLFANWDSQLTARNRWI